MPKTLLLADDSVTIQKVVGITFANEDVKLVTVDNGDDALTRAHEIKPDLVLADVSMPGLDGYALCAALKADTELSRIPVLLLTGTFETFDKARAAQAQVDAHIAKPFEAQALVDQVHQLLAREAPPIVEHLPAAAEPEAAPDFSFDDLDFEPTQPAAEPKVSATPPPPGPGLSTTVATPLVADAAAEPEAPSEADAPRQDDGDAKNEESPELDDALFSERSVLDGLEVAAPDDTTSSENSLEADPFSVDPADDLNDTADSGSGDLDPLGSSKALGELPVPPARPVAPDPTEKTIAWGIGESPLAQGPGAADENLAWVEPVTAEPEPVATAEPLLEAPIEDPEPAAVIAAADPLPAAPGTDAIRQVLEKLAWEAFGPLSEQLVREVVHKVEAIAWEVVPQLAERLIQDEIKRMKAHSSD